MADSGYYPKEDGDVYYGIDTNMAYYQSAQAGSMTVGVKSASTAAGSIVDNNSARKSLLVLNNGVVIAYLGSTNVTTSNGFKLNPGESIYLYNREEVYVVTASSTSNIRFMETYD